MHELQGFDLVDLALHDHLGIPGDVLLRPQGDNRDQPLAELDWRRFPLKAMAKRGWIPDFPDMATRAEELVGTLIERAGGRPVAAAALYRRTDTLRANAEDSTVRFEAVRSAALLTVAVPRGVGCRRAAASRT